MLLCGLWEALKATISVGLSLETLLLGQLVHRVAFHFELGALLLYSVQ